MAGRLALDQPEARGARHDRRLPDAADPRAAMDPGRGRDADFGGWLARISHVVHAPQTGRDAQRHETYPLVLRSPCSAAGFYVLAGGFSFLAIQALGGCHAPSGAATYLHRLFLCDRHYLRWRPGTETETGAGGAEEDVWRGVDAETDTGPALKELYG